VDRLVSMDVFIAARVAESVVRISRFGSVPECLLKSDGRKRVLGRASEILQRAIKERGKLGEILMEDKSYDAGLGMYVERVASDIRAVHQSARPGPRNIVLDSGKRVRTDDREVATSKIGQSEKHQRPRNGSGLSGGVTAKRRTTRPK
jgi:hypothetical protein